MYLTLYFNFWKDGGMGGTCFVMESWWKRELKILIFLG